MLIKINRQTAIEKYPKLPLSHYDTKNDDHIFYYPRIFANYVLTLPSKSYKGHVKLLGKEMVSLMQAFTTDTLVFMGDEDIPWLRRLNTYKNFQDSLQYLVDDKIGKRFNGALVVHISSIPVFIQHLAWLVRTNGVLPYIHFTDPGQSFVGNFCQYSNLHFSTLAKKADKLFKVMLPESKFELLTDKYCTNKFSKGGRIKGRSIAV